MRILGIVLAVMLLPPLGALAQTHGADTDVDIDGDLYVWNQPGAPTQIVVGATSAMQPYLGYTDQKNHVVFVRQPGSTSSSRPYSAFAFTNNQTDTTNGNIAQLTFVNEAVAGGDKRVGLIYVQTDGALNSGLMAFRVMNAGVGTNALVLDHAGDATFYGEVSAKVVEVRGADMAEMFDVRDEKGSEVKPGMVVSIDSENPGALTVSSKAYDRTVAGIISGAGDLKAGMLMGQKGTLAYGDHPVVLSGRAYCYVDATKAPVAPGDLLTTSDEPGHAMKVTDHAKAQGAIIGKAMTPLKSGRGLVMVLVSLQ